MARESKIEREAHEEHETVAEERKEHEKRARGGHATHAGMREASGGMELNTEGPMPGHPEDKHGGGAGETHHKRRRRGGRSEGEGEGSEHQKVQEYNAQGSKEMGEAGDEKPGFKKGGEPHKRRRHGGMAEGKMERERLDRRPRRAAGGGLHDPYSSAARFSPPENNTAGRGYESEKAAKG